MPTAWDEHQEKVKLRKKAQKAIAEIKATQRELDILNGKAVAEPEPEIPATTVSPAIPMFRKPRPRPTSTKQTPQWSPEWWEQASPEVKAHRCTAHNTKGDRCLRSAINGGNVCYTHGGATPHVKRAARARLENAADRMARELLGIAEGAESEAVKLSAVKDALDRAGLKPPTEIAVGTVKPYMEVFDGISTKRTQTEEPPEIPNPLHPAPAYPDDPDVPIVEAELVPEAEPEAPELPQEALTPAGPSRPMVGAIWPAEPVINQTDNKQGTELVDLTDALRQANALNAAAGALGPGPRRRR